MNDSNPLSSAARSIWDAGVASVRADALIRENVVVDHHALQIETAVFDRKSLGRVKVIGCGKAGAAMAAGLEAMLPDEFCEKHEVSGWVNIPEGTEQPTRWITLHRARPAGINEPTEAAVLGTNRILDVVSSLEASDLCIALISGGGSALLPAPRDGITLADKLAVTRYLSGAGANIEQLNTVRKQLSAVKGGRLLAACTAGNLVTLVISDVLGDPLDTIASGPTVHDSKTAADALAVLAQFDADRKLPASVYDVLESAGDEMPATSGCIATNVILGNNATAVDSAGIRAESLGFNHAMQSATKSEGEAGQIGQRMAKIALSMLRAPRENAADPNCLISGGEPVVRLAPAESRGRGGRNQQLVLAALDWLIDHGDLTPEERSRICILSGGTDGEDGPTDAAGAWVDEEVWRQCEARKLDVKDFLRRNDAYRFFEQCGGLILTGPTNTNVCDLRVVTVARVESA